MRRIDRQAMALVAATLVIDQLSKQLLLGYLLKVGNVVPVIDDFFRLVIVWNRGVSFGLLGGRPDIIRWALTVFAFVVAAVLAVWVRKADKALFASAIGLIIGGAIGNAIDRIRYGSVADFLDFSELMFPWVFNVADAGINVGIGLLILDTFVRRERAPQPR